MVVAIDEHFRGIGAQAVEPAVREPESCERSGLRPFVRRRRELGHDPVAIEDEHDELVGRVRVGANDQEEPAADRLGELDLGERLSRS